MALTAQQLQTLRDKLAEQKRKLHSVLGMIDGSDPALDEARVDDNADIQNEAMEDQDLVRSESLRAEADIMLKRVMQSLEQMEKGTYGTTADGQEIPYERLLIDPTATTLVS